MRLLCFTLFAFLIAATPALAEDQKPVDPGEAAFAVEEMPSQPDPSKPAWMDYQDPYIGEQNDIANPNKTPDEITSWAQQRAAEALSFAPETISAKLRELQKSFSREGWTQYADYLREVKVMDLVRDQQYSLATIFNGDATIDNSGAVEGAYRWLISAPLMVTFSKKDAAGEDVPAHSGKYRLIMQIGRSVNATDGLQIESWKVEADKPVYKRR